MEAISPTPNIQGPRTTADSAAEGRLKISVSQKKRKFIKNRLSKIKK